MKRRRLLWGLRRASHRYERALANFSRLGAAGFQALCTERIRGIHREVRRLDSWYGLILFPLIGRSLVDYLGRESTASLKMERVSRRALRIRRRMQGLAAPATIV